MEQHYRKQIRLRGYDYSQHGYYFVTICTQNRQHFFGEIRNGIMGLNELGCVVAKFWNDIPIHFPNVKLGKWVVMPNHVHGVIFINKPCPVGVQNFEPLQMNRYQHVIPKSLSSIIRAYKSAVTMWCNRNDHPHFKWQRSFYDHIIRNEKSLEHISHYIRLNPANWEKDVENISNRLSEKQIRRHYDELFQCNK